MFGLQFENLVLNTLQTLFPMLGLDTSLVLSAAPYCQRAAVGREGCQIDLLIQTQRMLMAVEIKRRREIGHGIIDEFDAKVKKLKFGEGKHLAQGHTAVGSEGLTLTSGSESRGS